MKEALIEMYLAGVSVRRMEDIIEALWGMKVSSGTISGLNKKVLWSSIFVTLVAKNLSDCCWESIEAGCFCQWCFVPLRGYAIDKTSHPRCCVTKQSNQEAFCRLSSCCRSRLAGRAAAVITVRAYMVAGGISEFLHNPVQLLFRLKFIQAGAFIFKSVEASLHWCIAVWISGPAHALGHMDGFAELCECL